MLSDSFELLILILLTLFALVGWLTNLVGMPGNWFIVVLAIGCCWLRPDDQRSFVGVAALAAIFSAALLGEILEFIAGALGVSRVGGTMRGSVLALLGSVAGAIVGLFAGTLIPIPIIGNLVAALLLGAAGAFLGAIGGERWSGKDWDACFDVGSAAFWGRLLGTVGKAVCGTVAGGIFLAAIWIR